MVLGPGGFAGCLKLWCWVNENVNEHMVQCVSLDQHTSLFAFLPMIPDDSATNCASTKHFLAACCAMLRDQTL